MSMLGELASHPARRCLTGRDMGENACAEKMREGGGLHVARGIKDSVNAVWGLSGVRTGGLTGCNISSVDLRNERYVDLYES